MLMSSSKTLATEVVKNDVKEIVFKLRQEYKPKIGPGKAVNSLVSLALDDNGKVVYHKDMVSCIPFILFHHCLTACETTTIASKEFLR